MLKRRLCEATFCWKLECEGPLLVADGRYSKEAVKDTFSDEEWKKKSGWYPDKFFINREKPEDLIGIVSNAGPNPPKQNCGFYIPGTSIRGPFRSSAERIIRSLLSEDAPPIFSACDPFEQDENSRTVGCSERLKKAGEDKSKYAHACSACRLFGCAGLAGRIRFTDADILECQSVYRDMIGIDRFTGGVYTQGGGANMRFHVLENTLFSTTVSVENFELWQLGLMAYVFRDFEDGLVPMGFGKTKGFGRVKGSVETITLKYPEAPTHIEHMGSLMSSAPERADYGIDMCESVPFDHFVAKEETLSLYHTVSVTNTPAFWAAVSPAFNLHVQGLKKKITGSREATS